ncbi:MAG: patatin-like phospholipase family protein [Gammaproteobacteria bacterium]|nr:patatin-like phospholipase family protein [Gammaproteobacteria bacterium]
MSAADGAAPAPKPVNLALQGGGAHGAFTWGVLDRMLEDGRVCIEGISGTSAGAMNAVVAADGLMAGGNEGARAALRRFWRAVADAAHLSPIRRSPIDVFMGNWSLDTSPSFLFFDLLSRVASPYALNPFSYNPILDLLVEQVDFARVQACDRMKIFVSATNVETGRIRVFERGEVTAQSVMASACLPFLFQAVEIDGVPYWDGGYMGNPALFPFFHRCVSDDIVIVQVNPVTRPGTPRSAREILNRINEITFNASLLRELRAIEFVTRLIDQGRLEAGAYHRIRVHLIEGGEALRAFEASSKLNAEWSFLELLFNLGREATDAWLERHVDDIGRSSTVDLPALYQGS